MSKPLSVAVAGSTHRTALCAQAVHSSDTLEVAWVLTPAPKARGRKQEVSANPVHSWADDHSVKTVLLENKLDEAVKNTILAAPAVEFLLVVDFGYLVPQWLLKLPQLAPLNIHPSLLPRWRGSSPGQFVLLYGEKNSAVTLMVMDEGLDSGPLITQLPFSVEANWTQHEYYQQSFELMREQLPSLMAAFAAHELVATPQPPTSPTPIARRLSRDDGFIEWDSLTQAMIGTPDVPLNPLLTDAAAAHPSPAAVIAAACRAFSPWPGIWSTVNGQRLKVLSCHTQDNHLILDQVQLEGKQPSTWQEIKSRVI